MGDIWLVSTACTVLYLEKTWQTGVIYWILMECDWWHKVEGSGVRVHEDGVFDKRCYFNGFNGIEVIFWICRGSLACFSWFLKSCLSFFDPFAFLFPILFKDVSKYQAILRRVHVLPAKLCLFSAVSYFSLCKHVGNCQKGWQTKVYVKSSLFCDEVEEIQSTKDAASTEEPVVVGEHESESIHINEAVRTGNSLLRSFLLECAGNLLQLSSGDWWWWVDTLTLPSHSGRFVFCSLWEMLNSRNDCSKLVWKWSYRGVRIVGLKLEFIGVGKYYGNRKTEMYKKNILELLQS